MNLLFLSHRPAIVVLLMSMVNDKQPFILRCSVLYCFVSFLYKNDLGQSQIIQTLLPSSTEGMQLLTRCSVSLLIGSVKLLLYWISEYVMVCCLVWKSENYNCIFL